MPCSHDFVMNRMCGVEVCYDCGEHKGLARCFCGWNLSAGERLQDDVGDATWNGEEQVWEVDY